MSEEIKKRIEERTNTMSSHYLAQSFKEGAEFGYQLGKDQVKAALRREIEKEIEYHNKTGPMAQESRYMEIGMLKQFLKLLDTVEPKR